MGLIHGGSTFINFLTMRVRYSLGPSEMSFHHPAPVKNVKINMLQSGRVGCRWIENEKPSHTLSLFTRYDPYRPSGHPFSLSFQTQMPLEKVGALVGWG